nr:hypothetical protein [uncultured Fluviicola sp.]
MKKLLFTLFLGFFSISVTAQKSGTFNAINANGKPSISIDKNKQFDSLTLNFPVALFNKDTKIILMTDEDPPIVIMDPNTLEAIGKLSSDGKNYVLSITQQNGKYFLNKDVLKTTGKKSIQLCVGQDVAAVFSLAPLKKFIPYKPGYILYDALYIAEAIKKNEKIDTARSILLHYEIDSSRISANAYLNPYINKLYINKTQGTKSKDERLSPFSMMSSVGNLDVTNFADGLAKFIVDRTKQELNIVFFDKFKEALSDPKYVDLKTVFPETYEVLMVIDNQIYNYDNYLQALRSAFDRDLSDLPNNLPSIIDNHSSYFDANPGLKVILQSSFYIAQQVQLKEHPGQMIANYPVDEFMGTETGINQNIAASFKTLQLVSKSFKSKTDSIHYWANDSLIKKLFNDDDAVKIYIGLLEQKAKQDNIAFGEKEEKKLWEIIDSSYNKIRGYEEYKNYFRTVSSKIRDIEKEIDALKEINKDSLKIEKYHTIAGKALDLMDHLTAVEKMPYFPKNLDIAKKAGIYIYSARTASDIVVDVNRKQYASAIMKTVMLYDTIFHKDGIDTFIAHTFEVKYVPKAIDLRDQRSKVRKECKKFIEQIAGKAPTADQKKKHQDFLIQEESISKQLAKIISDYRDSKSFKKWEDSTLADLSLTLSMTIKSLLKYGTFMSAIVDAKTSDDVEAAIEAAALPVGSARIKRESTFNIALNAYCGPYMGYERVYHLDPKWMSAKNSTINSYGLTAPVGISISYGGNCKKAKNHSSYSLFLSVIDVGAIASFRSNDTITEVLPTIQLKNILSPGIFFSYGIPTLPISVNAGWQMGPLLRKVDAQIDENTYSNRYGRISLSICIDIPIVNFYTFTSSKKPKFRL